MATDKRLYLKAFEIQKNLMTLTGLWPKEEYEIWYNCYGFIISLAIPAIFIMPSFLQIFSDSTTVTEASYILFSTITVFNYGIKVIILYNKRDLFRKILIDLEQPLFTGYEDFNEIYIKKAVFISASIIKLILFPCIIFIISIAAFPAIDSNNSSRPLPYDMPIDMRSLPLFIYVVIYFMEIIAASVCACNNASIDTLADSLVALATAQLQILEKNIKILVKRSSLMQFSKEAKLEDYRKFDDEIKDNVRTYVRHHIAITDYIDKLEEMFTYVFLAQFLTSVIVICIAGFSFIVTPLSNILFGALVSYFFAAMVEISMFCLFGDELIIQSLKVRDACYLSGWDMGGPEVRRSLLIIMERSKRPLFLTAAKFTTLSRESLVIIFKSSFSYFAVLRKLYGDRE